MELLGRSHKLVIWFTVLLTLLSIILLAFYEYTHGDVLSLTDQGTVTVTGDVPHIISINIKPESRIPPTGNDQLSLVVEIRSPGSVIPITSINTIANATGDASLGTIPASALPPGIYDVAIKGLSHLRKVYPNENFDGPVIKNYTLSLPQLPAGDANPTEDNYVNSLDISYITLHVYGNDIRADLTRDGIINSLDYAALLRNLSSYGDN
ncbi:hypothetical protein IT418_03105 [bacterium]|nr:hypothetical protein [bacterium]